MVGFVPFKIRIRHLSVFEEHESHFLRHKFSIKNLKIPICNLIRKRDYYAIILDVKTK